MDVYNLSVAAYIITPNDTQGITYLNVSDEAILDLASSTSLL